MMLCTCVYSFMVTAEWTLSQPRIYFTAWCKFRIIYCNSYGISILLKHLLK